MADLDVAKDIETGQHENVQEVSDVTGHIHYGLLAERRHPEYYGDFWARARAFYKGGVHLLENEPVMNAVFPRHVGEKDPVYAMRKKLAHYTNHSGAIVNHLLGKLLTDPVRMKRPDEDKFYTEFQEDCSPPGGEKTSLADLLTETLLTAAQCQRGYALVELPANRGTVTGSLAEQEESGELSAWCVPVQPESLVDWELDKAGEYNWVLLCFKSQGRESAWVDRAIFTEEYWYYDRKRWVYWKVEYKEDEEPKASDIIPPNDLGEHTFGKVPLVKFDLPDGLWVMSKLESLAREYFNKRNALSWAEFKALMPMLYEFLDPGIMPTLDGPGGGEKKATSQTRSVAHVQQRQAAAGQGDRAEWIAPPSTPFEHMLESANSVRDEMHRVVQQMALSADNKGANLRRSEGSKRQDSTALDTVLSEYGKLARKFLLALLAMVEAGRGDPPANWSASGLSKYDTATSDTLIEEEAVLDTVEIPSATFKTARKQQLVRKLLGDTVTEEELKVIDEEIAEHYSFEGELAQEEDELTREQLRAAMEEAANREEDEGKEEERDEDDFLPSRSKEKSKKTVISTFGAKKK